MNAIRCSRNLWGFVVKPHCVFICKIQRFAISEWLNKGFCPMCANCDIHHFINILNTRVSTRPQNMSITNVGECHEMCAKCHIHGFTIGPQSMWSHSLCVFPRALCAFSSIIVPLYFAGSSTFGDGCWASLFPTFWYYFTTYFYLHNVVINHSAMACRSCCMWFHLLDFSDPRWKFYHLWNWTD